MNCRRQRRRARLPLQGAGAATWSNVIDAIGDSEAPMRTGRRRQHASSAPAWSGCTAAPPSGMRICAARQGAAGNMRQIATKCRPALRRLRATAPADSTWKPMLPWIVALVILAAALLGLVTWRMSASASRKSSRCPTEWALAPRPVFSTDERRVYRQLREALPHHIVLSKLPLVRFCQPNDPQRSALLVRTARIDPRDVRHLQRQRARAGRDRSRHRPRQFAAGPADQAVGARRLPRALSALPGRSPAFDGRIAVAGAAERWPHRADHNLHRAARSRAKSGRGTAPRVDASARHLWQDSSFFQDSFFAPDNRLEASPTGELGGVHARAQLDIRRERARRHEPAWWLNEPRYPTERRHPPLNPASTRAYHARMTIAATPATLPASYADLDPARVLRHARCARPARRRTSAAVELLREPRLPGPSWRTAQWWSPSSIVQAAGPMRRSSKSTPSRASWLPTMCRWSHRVRSRWSAMTGSVTLLGEPPTLARSSRGQRRTASPYATATPAAARSSKTPIVLQWFGRFLGRLHAVGARRRLRVPPYARPAPGATAQAQSLARWRSSIPDTELGLWQQWCDGTVALIDAAFARAGAVPSCACTATSIPAT